MFFQNAFGGGMGGGSPSAFTSPGMNPQALAQLMAMQGTARGPSFPQLPQRSMQNAAPAPGMPPQQMPQDNMAQMMQLMRMMGNNGGGLGGLLGGLFSQQQPGAPTSLLPPGGLMPGVPGMDPLY